MGSRAGLGILEKRYIPYPCCESNHDYSAHGLVSHYPDSFQAGDKTQDSIWKKAFLNSRVLLTYSCEG